MNDKQALKAISSLIMGARADLQMSAAAFYRHAGIDSKTLKHLETGDRPVRADSLSKVESALGWRVGSLSELWRDREDIPEGRVFTAADMKLGAETWKDLRDEETPSGGSVRASQLMDEELAVEMLYRIRTKNEKLAQLEEEISRLRNLNTQPSAGS